MREKLHGDSRSDFELACIREFAHSGLQLNINISREERRERIRAAIFREGKQHLQWQDSDMTYAAAYRQAYHQPLEAREGDPQSLAPMINLAGRLSDPEPDEGLEDPDDGSTAVTPESIR
jgi:hypothetical protein